MSNPLTPIRACEDAVEPVTIEDGQVVGYGLQHQVSEAYDASET